MILSIVLVITVPIVLGVIDSAKRGSVIDSAYGYKAAISEYYLEKLSDDSSYIYPNGIYFVDENGYLFLGGDATLEISISGEKPTSLSWVNIENGIIKDYSLKFGDYVVNFDEDTKKDIVLNDDVEEIVGWLEASRILISRINAKESADVYVNDVLLAKKNDLKINKEDVSMMVSDIDVALQATQVEEGWIYFSYDDSDTVIVTAYSLKFEEEIDGINYITVVNYDNGKKMAINNGNVLVKKSVSPYIANVIDGVSYYTPTWTKLNPVYYNPINDAICNQEVYEKSCDENKQNCRNSNANFKGNADNGCMKWYAYSENGDGTINMILDHNTNVSVRWYTSNDNSKSAITALEKMNGVLVNGIYTVVGDTSGWIKVPARKDKYIATWDNGTEIITTEIDYTGYKARLITAQEIVNIIDEQEWDNSLIKVFYFGSLTNKNYSNQNSAEKNRQKKYSWLFDNMFNSLDNGGTRSQRINGNYGYWTSTPVSGYSDRSWLVYHAGILDVSVTKDTYGNFGIRPVITIPEI